MNISYSFGKTFRRFFDAYFPTTSTNCVFGIAAGNAFLLNLTCVACSNANPNPIKSNSLNHYSQYCSASFLFFTVLCAATKQTIFSWYLCCICYAAGNQFGTSPFSLWTITIYNIALTIFQSRYAFNLSGEMVPLVGCLEIDQLPPVLARK